MDGNASVGHPVDVATGVVHNAYMDVTIPGKVDLTWERSYSTALIDRAGPLGPGWSNRYFCSLTLTDEGYLFTDAQGSEIDLNDPDNTIKQGEVIRDLGAFTEIRWQENRYNVVQWDVDTGEVWTYVFNIQANGDITPLQELNDVTGQGLEFAYDEKARLVGIRQKLEKRALILSYSSRGQVEQVEFISSDKKCRQTLVKYYYDTHGRLSEIRDALGNKDNFEYDTSDCITRELGKDGSVFNFKYDNKGRCVHSVGIDGYDEKSLRYIDAVGWTEVTDSLGNIRRFQHNADGQIIREINPLGAEYLTEYDDHGRIMAKTDSVGAVTRFEYDDFGNRSLIIDALGQKTEIQHNDYHLPTSYINAAGYVWRRIYDIQNRLTGVIDPEDNRYLLIYDDKGNLAEIADPLNNCLRQSFTGTGVLHAATDWRGNVTAYKGDEYGRLVQKIDPLGATTHYQYDALNNLTIVSYPDGTEYRYQYDAGGNLIHVVDRNENTTKYRYAPCKRLLERIDPLGNKLYFSWGSEPQRLEVVTNPKGEIYHFEYNEVGWVIGETGFDGRKLGFEYDLAGNRIASINGMGERIIFERDALGRLTKQLLPDGSTADFTYNSAGFLQSAVNADSTVEFERDSLGRIICETQNGHLIEREYDSVGNLAVIISSLGHRIDYEFDANGLLIAFKKDKKDSIQIERDVRGSEIGRILPGGLRLAQQYDAVGRLLDQELSPISRVSERQSLETPQALVKRSYRYEKAQLVGIQDKTWGATTYVYDPAEHMINALRDKGASEKFSYDANDNLRDIERNGELETFTYGTGDRLQVKGSASYEYDDQGHLVLKKETDETGQIKESRYCWDALDQLRSFETPEGEIWEYAYDAFGRRIQKKAPDGLRYGFVWDEDVVLHETLDDELSVSWTFDPHSFAPLCKYEEEGVYSVITDHLGTPREMVDQFGKMVWQVDYYAWGEVKERIKDEVDCPVRFQGQWWDEESNLHYNRFRFYSPICGSFITEDPLTLYYNSNLYSYVKNPNSWIDPLGLCDDDPDLLKEAETARDKRAEELGPLPSRRRPAAVTAGYNIETGQVEARASGGRRCAEAHVVDALGGDKSKVRFTKAVRPRPHSPPYSEVPVCPSCEASYGRSAFPEGTRFKSDEN